MSSSKEKCQNCLETFYQQSLVPLELVDFTFAGQKLTLIGCFVESTDSEHHALSTDCPKVCRTCLDLLNTTFISAKPTNGQKTAKSTHKCATCSEYYPANVMMSLQLTMVNSRNGTSVKLIECYKSTERPEMVSKESTLVCLACVSETVYKFEPENYVKSEIVDDEFETEILMKDIKAEPTVEIFPMDYESIECKKEPEQISVEFNDSIQQSDEVKHEPAKRVKKSEDTCFECHFCSKQFRQKRNLYYHMDQHRTEKRIPGQSKPTDFTCTICQQEFKKKQQLDYHVAKHYSKPKKDVECHHCPDYKAKSKSDLVVHMREQHAGPENRCLHCGEVFVKLRDYQKHMNKHGWAKELQCPGCKRIFLQHRSYTYHMQTQTEVVNCEECGAGFHSARRLDIHMANVHNKFYPCEICKLPLANISSYNSHMLSQHGVQAKPKCKHCGREFETAAELATHEKTEHKAQVLNHHLICEWCGKSFGYRELLISHYKSHRLGDSDKNSGDEKAKCDICGKVLKNKLCLRIHIRSMHVNKKPSKMVYTCPKCPQWKFAKRQYLQGHMIIHNTDGRPFFECHLCGIAYTRRQKLDVHKRKCT